MIPVSAFYEFTDPPAEAQATLAGVPAPTGKAPKARTPKAKWAFTLAGHDWFCIAGLWRGDVALKDGGVGEAWTMLTCPPGPDMAPYHPRQVVVLGRSAWARWLDPAVPAAELCRAAPAGSLLATRVR